MVALSVVEAANTACATDKSAGRPYVAVVAGGTSGIGMYAVQSLARTHGRAGQTVSRGLRVFILGRRASDELLAACRELCPFGQFVFLQAEDLGLVRDVDRVCASLIKAEREASAAENHPAKIDLLVESQGILHFGGRVDTAEGLEQPMAIGYYGRARIVDRLLPLLTETVSPPSVGHVAFVMNPNLEGSIVESDLSLRVPKNFTLRNRGSHLSIFSTFYMEALAAKNPGTLSLVHYYPGAVKTGLAQTSNLGFWAKLAFRVAMALMRLSDVPEEESGQRVMFLGTTACFPPAGDSAKRSLPTGTSISKGADDKVGSGAYRINYDDDTLKNNDKAAEYRAKGLAETIYAHTQRAFAVIESGKKFTE